MLVEIFGTHQRSPVQYTETFVPPDTAAAAGMGTGSIAQVLLSGELHAPGVWPVERAMPTDLFQVTSQQPGTNCQFHTETSDVILSPSDT